MKTIGHSNRSEEVFMELLEKSGCNRLVDVRTTASSRFTQFKGVRIKKIAEKCGMVYRHEPALGGRTIGDQTYYKVISSTAFIEAVRRLNGDDLLMCSERNPLNCHRFVLLTRYLERENGVEVNHIMAEDYEVNTSHLERMMCRKLGGIFVKNINECYDLRLREIVLGKMWY